MLWTSKKRPKLSNMVNKIKTNPKKETLVCGWEVSFDKKDKGKIKKLEWTHEVLKDWKPETDL
jgi:hypothetical protein